MTTTGNESPTQPSLPEVAAQLEILTGRLRAASDKPMAHAVADAAMAMVPGATWCSITIREKGRYRSLVATDDHALRIDQVQYDAGTGPCLEAIATERVTVTEDLRVGNRWPATRVVDAASSSASDLT